MPLSPVAGPTAPAPRRSPAPGVRSSFGDALRAAAPAARRLDSPSPHPARAVLESIEQARVQVDSALAAARRGRTFTAAELLSMQAGAYRFSQTVELASKVVEGGAQAVRQAVNSLV
jgi:CHAD domain-containing protein